jgi:hypothetical protein
MHPSCTRSVPPALRTPGIAGPAESTLDGPADRIPAEDPPGSKPRHGSRAGAGSESAGGAA